MKSMRLIGSLSCIMLVMAISAVAQPSSSPAPVLDSAGRPLQRGVEYYINPAITDSGGRFTLIDRNDSCPFYVGQENVSGLEGFPVIFTPFVEGETVIRENRDFRVVFSAATICVQSTAWKLGETDPETKRRLIRKLVLEVISTRFHGVLQMFVLFVSLNVVLLVTWLRMERSC
ncbi:hypothetical protein CMV_026912 [Castanea mollissima]|uniref:Uncharacterized protein n=1 Tax=Castanea mollissima TaxID=60419 RepID=A0A8J4QG91_9ROSI|nr:hypothetical protein CMV_026912 [Castanea mollissima]